MPLDKLPFWDLYERAAAAADAELLLGRVLEPYHLLLLNRCMSWDGVGHALAVANRRAGLSKVAFERRPSAVAGSNGQRVRYE